MELNRLLCANVYKKQNCTLGSDKAGIWQSFHLETTCIQGQNTNTETQGIKAWLSDNEEVAGSDSASFIVSVQSGSLCRGSLRMLLNQSISWLLFHKVVKTRTLKSHLLKARNSMASWTKSVMAERWKVLHIHTRSKPFTFKWTFIYRVRAET